MMAIRICPYCGKTVPIALVVAYPEGVEFPRCQRRLTVSNGSRVFSSTVGPLVAALVYWLTRNSPNILGFALPVLFGVLAFGCVAALVLILTTTLRITTNVLGRVGTHDNDRNAYDYAGLRR
jgi:hypothetical protein